MQDVRQVQLFREVLKTCLGAITLYATLVTDVAAQGYDVLEISPPPGYLARRAWLSEKGISVDIRYTGFYQGLVSGTGDEDFQYGDKWEAFINFDSSKFGLREGGGFRSHLEYARDNALVASLRMQFRF